MRSLKSKPRRKKMTQRRKTKRRRYKQEGQLSKRHQSKSR
jgi:hypothetical protein